MLHELFSCMIGDLVSKYLSEEDKALRYIGFELKIPASRISGVSVTVP